MFLTTITEDEKKVIAPLLAKLYISPASTEDNIRGLYDEVSIAVDGKLVSDATSRNALFKIHVNLGKIVNNLGEQEGVHRSSRSVSVAVEDQPVAQERPRVPSPGIKEEEEEDEGTVIHHEERDSLVEDLLTDEDIQ
jgi:condensin complex subunit 3